MTLLAIGIRIADDIRERVAASTGIPADSILVCATHTHSAPAFNIFATPRADAKPAEGRDLEWERALPEKIASRSSRPTKILSPRLSAPRPLSSRSESIAGCCGRIGKFRPPQIAPVQPTLESKRSAHIARTELRSRS